MISESAFTSSVGLATQLTERGYVISANPSTLVGELVRLSTPIDQRWASPVPDGIEPENDLVTAIQDYGRQVTYFTTGIADSASPHSLEISADIDTISKAVRAHISFAKQTVNPLVLELAERLHNWKLDHSDFEPGKHFNIEIQDAPVVLKDQVFMKDIQAYDGKSPLLPSKMFALDAIDHEHIMEVLLTGDSSTDTLIQEWISSLDHGFLCTIWRNVFTTEQLDYNSSYGVDIGGIAGLNLFHSLNAALAVYLLARKLYEKPDYTNAGLSLIEHRKMAAEYRDWAGSLVSSNIKRLNIFSKANTMVVDTNDSTKTIRVNGEIYREWLANGGSPEVILGLLVSGQKVYLRNLIDQHKDGFLTHWVRYCNYSRTAEANNAFTQFKTHILYILDDLMREPSESEREYMEANPAYMAKYQAMVKDELDRLVFKDMADPVELAMTFIAKCRFYYTSAYDILKDINHAQTVNPDIDVREAALLAVISYVTKYVTDQITVKPV